MPTKRKRRKKRSPTAPLPGVASLGLKISGDVPADYQLRLQQRPHAQASVAVVYQMELTNVEQE